MFPVACAVLLSMCEREDFTFLGVLKIVCGWASKTWLLPYACCGLHFWPTDAAGQLSCYYAPPCHYNFGAASTGWVELPETTDGWVTTAQTTADNPDDHGQPLMPGTTTSNPASHQHHWRRTTTDDPGWPPTPLTSYNWRPRLASNTSDIVQQLTTTASHQHHWRPRLATSTIDAAGQQSPSPRPTSVTLGVGQWRWTMRVDNAESSSCCCCGASNVQPVVPPVPLQPRCLRRLAEKNIIQQ